MVSELGHDHLKCPRETSDESPAAFLTDAVKYAVRESAGLETRYGTKRATKVTHTQHTYTHKHTNTHTLQGVALSSNDL